jgi:hypothetical protein
MASRKDRPAGLWLVLAVRQAILTNGIPNPKQYGKFPKGGLSRFFSKSGVEWLEHQERIVPFLA